MNINQHFSNLAAKAAEEGADASQLISQRERLFKDKVIPELTKRGANDTAIVQAREKWYSQTDKVMQSAGLLPKAGQNSRSFAKDKRADKAVQEAAKTGSKLPIIKETIKSTGETIGNLFGQGVGSTIESAAGFVRDIGENEQDSISAKVADYGKNLRKEYDNSASSFQKDLQAGGSGKAAQLATGAIQSVPAMAMPFGAAKVVAKGAGAFNATKAAAPYLGMGAGVVAGHTQNYGEVRRNATENLARDFPTWEKMQGNPLFEQNFQEKLNSGLGINQARQQAHAATLDALSEQAANKYGSAMTAIDFIAPSGAVLGSGILKNAPTSQIGKKLVGGGVDSSLVKREMQQVPRTGMAKLVPDMSIAANKAAAKMVGKQALEEGLQGGIGEYGAQAASANIGGTPVDYGKVGQTILEEGLIGGIMGGGMQSATGGSPTSQAKDVAKQLRNQTNTLRQEEAAARKELADAMQLNDPQQIQSAQDNLNNIGAEASKVKAAYDQYGIDTPYFVERFAAQYQPQQQQAAQQGPAAQPQPQPQPTAQPQAAAQPQPTPAAPFNQGMANTTNLVMDSVSNGFITPEEAQAIQTDPIRADVFTLTMTGDVAAAHNVVMNAVSLGNIDTDQAQELIQSITRYSQAKAPKKPSVSSIVNNHVKQQIHPQDRGLFSNPVELDPETFEPIDPNQPSPFQDDFNEPKAFSNPSKANDYVRINGLTDSHDIEIAEDGTLVVVKKQGIIPDDPNLSNFGYEPERIVQPTPADPNLSNFSEGMVSVDSLNADNVPDVIDPEEVQQPVQPIPTAQPDHNKPKTFTNYVRANDYLKSNGLKDSHEIIKKGEGQIIVQPKSAAPVEDFGSDQAFDDMLNAVPPAGTPAQNPVEPVQPTASFADQIRDAHLNKPSDKPKLIQGEVAKGRPRAEVLAEVSDVVKAISMTTTPELKADTPELAPEEKPLSYEEEQEKQKQEYLQKVRDAYAKDPESVKQVIDKEVPIIGNFKDRLLNIAEAMGIVENLKKQKNQSNEQKTGENGIRENDEGEANIEGRVFPSLGAATRYKNAKKLKGYAPHKVDNGYSLRKVNDDYYNKNGKIIVGNADNSDVVLKADLLQSFDIFGHKFYVVKTDAIGNVYEVIGAKTHLTVPKQAFDANRKQGDEEFFYPSQKQALEGALKVLTEFGAERLNKSPLIQADYNADASIAIAEGKQAQPIDVMAAKAKLAQEEKLEQQQKEINKLRDENGKLDPFSDNPMARVKAVSEMNFLERFDFEEKKLKHFAKPGEAIDQDALDIRHKQLAENTANSNATQQDRIEAHKKLVNIYRDEINKHQSALESNELTERERKDNTHHLETAQKKLPKSEQFLAENGVKVEPVSRAEPDTVQEGATTEVKANESNNVANNASNSQDITPSSTRTSTTTEQTTTPGERNRVVDSGIDRADPANTDNVEGAGNAAASGAERSNDGASTQRRTVEQATEEVLDQANPPLINFKITDDAGIGEGTLTEKFNTNIEVIKLVNKLDAEQRQATVEERALIAKYVGWGGLSQAFDVDGHYSKGWEEKGKLLKSLLSEDDYKNAAESTTSAFYTPTNITKAMWSAVEKLGFKGGLVLEPSVGVGNFLGLSPESLHNRFISAEKDGITARIAQHLYPQSKVFHSGYEELSISDGMFDLAIGNPPYGSAVMNFKDKPHLNRLKIHNQFMLGTIENIKPNGISVMIISHSFMDAKERYTRYEIAKKAELLGAVRLPTSAFKDSANTAVITDILVFQKRPEHEIKAIEEEGFEHREPSWIDSGSMLAPDGSEIAFNKYFSTTQGNIIGDLDVTTNQYGGYDYTIKHKGDIQPGLDNFVKSLPKTIRPDTAAQLVKKANDAYEQTLSHLLIAKSGLEIGAVSRDDKGLLYRVIEQETESGHILKTQSLSPETVWSSKYNMDKDGNYYTLEPKTDEKGKKVYIKDQDGKDTKRIVYERVIVPESQIHAASKLGKTGFDKLSRLTDMRDSLRTQLDLELNDSDDIERNRKVLRGLYDDFVKKHGYISSPSNAKLVDELPDAALMFALESGYKRAVKEIVGKKADGSNKLKMVTPEKASPADILSKRVVFKKKLATKADSASDGVSLSLAHTGRVNLDLVSTFTKKPVEQLIDEMHTQAEKPLIFFDVEENQWVTSQKYLSGNVRQKLKAAEAVGNDKNAEALRAVIPKDIDMENITFSLGMHWIPAEAYSKFAAHLTDDGKAQVTFEPVLGNFEVEAKPSQAKSSLYGSPKASPEWILNRILNNKSIRITKVIGMGRDAQTVLDQDATEQAIQMAETIKMEFSDWVYSQQDIAENLRSIFNEKFNNIVPEKFDGSHLQFVGKVPDELIELRTHQVDAVWRGVTNNFVLYDHAVGSGKTFTGIARAMERKRLGLSKKPTIVVPNHMVEQFAADVYRLYPAAKVLAAGKRDFEKKNRKRLFAKIATGDYDIIVVPHSSFEFIKLSPTTEMRYMEQELDQIMAAIKEAKDQKGSDKRHTIKQLKETESRIRSKLEAKRNSKRRDSMLTFEQLGIDDITVDEAHEFKNLFYHSNLSSVVGMGNPSGSGKAFDLFNKFRYLHDIGGAGAFMTGTPISNSAVEMHTMMRYLMPKVLKSYGLEKFDSWAKLFADNTTKFEATESGKLKQVTRFARDWKNMRSLMDLWYTVVDPVTNEDVKADYKARKGVEFPLPQVEGGSRQSVVVAPTQAQVDLLEEVIFGFEQLDTISDSKERNAARLRLMDRARKLSLDARAVDPVTYAGDNGGKLTAVANKVAEVYKQWDTDKGTQIIFLDRSVPKSKGDEKIIKEYDDILAKLEEAEAQGDMETLIALQDKLDKFDANEIQELRVSQNSNWNAYDEIKNQLIAQGIPADEIRFVQEANNDEQKQILFNQVKTGEVRVIIGSTPRMGAGTNIQDRLVHLHHVDVTWKPSDIEQREGRIIRQGNKLYAKYGHDNFKVGITAYVTERTTDAKLWDVNSAKLKTINGIRHYQGDFNMDFGQDADNVSMQEIAALASGNPLMLERVTLDAEIQQLQRQKANHARKVSGYASQVSKAKATIKHTPDKLQSLEETKTVMDDELKSITEKMNSQKMSIDGQQYQTREEAEDALQLKYEKARAAVEEGKRVSVSYSIDGETVNSMTKARELVKARFSILEPFGIVFEGREYNSALEFASDNFAGSTPKWLLRDSKGPAFEILGLQVEITYASSTVAHFDLQTKDGKYGVAGYTYNPDDFTAIKLANAVLTLAKKAKANVPYSITDAKQSVKESEKIIKELEPRLNESFPKEQEMLDKQDRLKEVTELLTEAKKGEESDQEQRNSRRSGAGKGSTPDQVRAELVSRFGEDTIQQLEQKGILSIVPTYAEQGVEGFAENGRVTLVADAITPENIVPVFLHELGGHVGMQGVMKPEAYAVLMKEFNRLVKAGDPAALKAKRLAERETDADVQADEYLPYLITVAAQNQAKQGPVQKLISRVLGAVKAWAVDRLGLNLKLSPSDMVALAERMVKTVSKGTPPTPPKGQRRYSRSSTANPQNMSRTKQREFLDKAAATAFGQMSLRGAEASKTLSNRTLNLFQTMLHKALKDETGEFKKTFDLVQGKINHVTFASSKSMDVAPNVLIQLEEGSDYWKEVKRVGRTMGHTLSGGKIDKAKVDKDLKKIGDLMFENTLLDNSERHTVKELKQLGFDDEQISLYNEVREAIDTSLDTFANTTFSNIYKHLGGTTEEVLELAGKDLDIVDHYNEILKRIDALTKGKPEKADARQAAIEAIDRVFKKANDLKDQGYVPLMRFGKYFVRIYNPTTGEVAYRQHFESESERNLFYRNYDKANIPAGYEIEQGQINELQHKLFQGVSPETVALFAKESGLPIGDAETAYIKYAVQNNHALKRLLKRQGIDGFDSDLKRVLASFVMSNARYSANQTYNPAIDESIADINDPAYQEDAIRLRDYSLDTQEELAAVKNFAFVWYMGFSAMFGLVNLTQPLLQTFPYLMQYSKDHGTILKAFGKAVTTWRKGTNVMDQKYKAHYERARKEGHLDPQNTWMMQGLERGKSGLGASTWQLVSHASGLFAQASETVNRRTSLFAALDVAESMGQAKLEKLGFKDAYDFAVRTIQETQGIYNKGNRPRLSRGNVGSMLMMYKQFMIAYIEQMVRMQKSGLYGGDDDEFKKKMAGLVGFGISRSVLTMLGILMAFSGTSGLPFVRDILDGIETAGGLVGKPVNTEREIQIALHDALGQTMGSAVNTALMDGIVNLNPLIDVKGRMGMGDLIPATAYFSPTTSDYMKSSEISQIAGPIGGLLEKLKESVALAQVGAYGQSGVQLLPKAVTSMGQGAIAATTGDYRNMKTGVKTNDATVLDGIVKMLDAQPAGIAKEGRVRGLEMKDKSSQIYLNKRWKERYEAALESGNRENLKEVKQQIRDYNKENPRYPIKFNQKLAETNFNKSNQTWQEKRKTVKGLEWMSEYNPYLDQ